jgi:hypothetical protein
MTYRKNKTTGDKRWRIPDQVDAAPFQSCLISSTVSVHTSSASFQETLKEDISLEGSFPPFLSNAAFSANKDYQKNEKSFQTQTLLQTQATCVNYKASLDISLAPQFTDNFVQAVGKMPLVYSSNDPFWLDQWFIQFGTSYSMKVRMGAKAVYQYVMDSNTYFDLVENSVKVTAGAQLSFMKNWGFDVQSSSNYNDYKQFNDAMSQVNSATYVLGVGSQPPLDPNISSGSWTVWLNAVSLFNCLSVVFTMFYTLIPISNLLTRANFPNEPNIMAKQAALTSALKGYCSMLNKCGPPPPTPPPTALPVRKLVSVHVCQWGKSCCDMYGPQWSCGSEGYGYTLLWNDTCQSNLNGLPDPLPNLVRFSNDNSFDTQMCVVWSGGNSVHSSSGTATVWAKVNHFGWSDPVYYVLSLTNTYSSN